MTHLWHHHVAFVVLNWLRLLLRDADSDYGCDRFMWRDRFLCLRGLFWLLTFSRLLLLGNHSGHASHLIAIEADLIDPCLEFLGADALCLRLKSVKIPETLKSKVENASV